MRTDQDTNTLFTRQHEAYRRGRPDYPAQLYARLVALLPASMERALAWDCGCGSGQATMALTAYFERVVATDISQPQLDAATPHERVDYLHAPAHDVPSLRDQSVALVTAATAFHWFDQQGFFNEAWRVLEPQGVLAIWSYATHTVRGSEPIDQWTHALMRGELEPYWMPQNIALMEHGYARATIPFEGAVEVTQRVFGVGDEALTSRASMSLSQYLDYVCSWSASQRFLEREGESVRARFGGELERLWIQSLGSKDALAAVEWPLFGRVFQRG